MQVSYLGFGLGLGLAIICAMLVKCKPYGQQYIRLGLGLNTLHRAIEVLLN